MRKTVTLGGSTVLPPRPAARVTRKALRRNLVAYAFIAPFLVLFIIFHIIPFFWALWLSLLEGDLVSPVKPFVGLKNYASLLTDDVALQVFRNTVQYVLTAVPITIVTGIALAFLITNRYVKRPGIFRAILYLPILASGAAVAQVWSYILAPQFGFLSYVMSLVGLPDVYWLSDTRLALWAIFMVNWWAGIGFHVVLFTAAILGVPRELHDAAYVDGANAWQVATRITIPLLRPVVTFSVVMGTIWAFQLFDTVFVMTQGGPSHSTATMVWYIYNYAFRYGQVGMAAAMGVALLFIIMPISLIQMRVLRQNTD